MKKILILLIFFPFVLNANSITVKCGHLKGYALTTKGKVLEDSFRDMDYAINTKTGIVTNTNNPNLRYTVLHINKSTNSIVFYGNNFGRSQLIQYNIYEKTLTATFINNKKGDLGNDEILSYQVANTKCKHQFK